MFFHIIPFIFTMKDPSGTERCYKKADDVGKPLFCAFNRRFDPSYASIRKKVQEGELGHIQVIKTTSRDSPLPSLEYLKISGGIFHDCAVHDIDLVTWIIGEYPSKVKLICISLIILLDRGIFMEDRCLSTL